MARTTREVSVSRAIEGLLNKLADARQKVADLEMELAAVQGKIQGAMPRPVAAPLPVQLREMPSEPAPGIPGEVNPADNPEEGRWL